MNLDRSIVIARNLFRINPKSGKIGLLRRKLLAKMTG